MRRREFIAGLGGAAAWPKVTRAQQPERMRRIAVLLPANPTDPELQAYVGAFLQGLQRAGWVIGRNVQLAEAGCTPHEISAITGHRSLSEVARYTRAAEQKRLAGSAMTKLQREHPLTNLDVRFVNPTKTK